jgi:hypothetical protein
MSVFCREPEAPSRRRDRLFAVLLLGILALAALLRLGALRAEFWFDEIWSWEFARAAESPWQILAGAQQHHDNNHKLNTLFLSLYPRGAGWWWYRLHSFVAGLVAVGLAALVARRRGRVEAVFAALLFAVNYWLVLCSAEARGYALAVCFALLALYALQTYLTRGGRRMLVLFWISAILGFSAHLTFLHCYLALGLWSVYHLARRRQSPRAEIGQLLACHAVPVLFVVVLYVLDIRRMELGGGPSLSRFEVVGRLLSLGMGGPPSASWFLPLAVVAAVAFALGLRLLARDADNAWLFFAVVIVGSPALFLLGKPAYLFERYFLISFVFFLLLLSYVLAWLWRSSRQGTIVASGAVLAIVSGSLWQVVDFERGGRGQFLDALAYIERESPGDVVRLSGDYDFRVRKFCAFYVPYLHSGKQFVYHEQNALPAGGADWLLVHRLDDSYPLREQLSDKDDHVYQRVKDFRIATFGGWSWHVYRKVHGD